MRTLFAHELIYYFKNRIELVQFIGLFISVILLIPFGQAGGNFHYQSLAAGIVWIALTVAVSLAGSSLFQRDYDSGKLEAYQSSNLSLEVVILAKWGAYLVALLVPLLLTLPVILIILNIQPSDWLRYVLGLISGAIDLTLITTLISILMVGSQRIGAILALVVLPLTIPVIIFGAHYLSTAGSLLQPDLLFLWGFAACLLPILCLAGRSCIRASN